MGRGADALEPVIDEQTMRIHHLMHHNAYLTTVSLQPAEAYNEQNASLLSVGAGLARPPRQRGILGASTSWELIAKLSAKSLVNRDLG